MLILLIIVFLLIVSATLFLICRKRKKGKIVYAISMGIFLLLFLRYQRESGILKNFSDYKEAYYENYNGEIRFVLNGDKRAEGNNRISGKICFHGNIRKPWCDPGSTESKIRRNERHAAYRCRDHRRMSEGTGR